MLIRSTANKRLVRKGYSTRNARGFAGSLAKRWNAPTANNIRTRLIAEREARKLAREAAAATAFAKEAQKQEIQAYANLGKPIYFVQPEMPAENVMMPMNMSRPSSVVSDPGVQTFMNNVPPMMMTPMPVRPTPMRRTPVVLNTGEPQSLVNVPLRNANVPLGNANVPLRNANIPLRNVNVPLGNANVPLAVMNMRNAGVNMAANMGMPFENVPVMPVAVPNQGNAVNVTKQLLERNREELARLFNINVKGENKPMALQFKCRTFKSTVLDPLDSVTEKLVRQGKTQTEQNYIRQELQNNLAIMEEGCAALVSGNTNVDKKFLGRTSAFLSALHDKYVKSAGSGRRNRKTKKNRKH